MELLDLSGERLPFGNALLKKEVTLTPNDPPQQLEFFGLDRQEYGITRILLSVFINASTLSGQESSAVEIGMAKESGRQEMFGTVLGQSIQTLFRHRVMQVPEVIDRNQSLQVEVNAFGAAGIGGTVDHRVSVMLVGLSGEQLEARRSTLEDRLGFVPERRWAYAPSTSIPATTDHEPVEIITDSVPGFFKHYAAGNAELNINSLLRLESIEKELAPDMRLDILEDEYLTRETPYYYETEPFEPLNAEFSNLTGSSVRHSFLADSLHQDVLDAIGVERPEDRRSL